MVYDQRGRRGDGIAEALRVVGAPRVGGGGGTRERGGDGALRVGVDALHSPGGGGSPNALRSIV